MRKRTPAPRHNSPAPAVRKRLKALGAEGVELWRRLMPGIIAPGELTPAQRRVVGIMRKRNGRLYTSAGAATLRGGAYAFASHDGWAGDPGMHISARWETVNRLKALKLLKRTAVNHRGEQWVLNEAGRRLARTLYRLGLFNGA